METQVYNNRIVKEHSLYSSCGSTLNEVSNRDYPHKDYFNQDIACLDIDTYEKEILRKNQPENTVDAVIGISSYMNNREFDTKLLMIELRIGYRSTSNLSKKEMEGKVTYTKSLLGSEQPINSVSLFIFNEKVAQQAQWWFKQQQRTGGEFSNCTSCSISQFSNLIKSKSDFPYSPIHKKEDITSKLLELEGSKNWDAYREQIQFWCRLSNDYEYKNPDESKNIRTIIKELWLKFREDNLILSEDEELECLIIEEDNPFLTES